jgi:hypothetical protein
MKAPEKLVALVETLPGLDRKGLLSDVDKAAVEQTLAAIEQGGRDYVVGLVDLLVEPGRGGDVKARYALHALAVRAAGKGGRRRAFAEALASTLGGGRPKEVQGFVVRQLQVAGGQEVVGALGKLLADGELYEYAALALLAIRDGAAEQFRKALPGSAGKRRLTFVQALGVLRDAAAAGALKELAGDPDRDTRLAALWALAKVGDPGAVDLLIKAAGAEGYERTQATKACLVLAERLLAAGRKAEASRVYTYLRDSRTGPAERYVRDAATRGLAAAK